MPGAKSGVRRRRAAARRAAAAEAQRHEEGGDGADTQADARPQEWVESRHEEGDHGHGADAQANARPQKLVELRHEEGDHGDGGDTRAIARTEQLVLRLTLMDPDAAIDVDSALQLPFDDVKRRFPKFATYLKCGNVQGIGGEALLRQRWGPTLPDFYVEYLRRNDFFFTGTDDAKYEREHYGVDRENTFAQLFGVYCARQGFIRKDVRFYFKGSLLDEGTTPADFDMKDYNAIGVIADTKHPLDELHPRQNTYGLDIGNSGFRAEDRVEARHDIDMDMEEITSESPTGALDDSILVPRGTVGYVRGDNDDGTVQVDFGGHYGVLAVKPKHIMRAINRAVEVEEDTLFGLFREHNCADMGRLLRDADRAHASLVSVIPGGRTAVRGGDWVRRCDATSQRARRIRCAIEDARAALEGLRPVMIGQELIIGGEEVRALDRRTWDTAYDLAVTLALAATSLGDDDATIRYMEDAVASARMINDPNRMAMVYFNYATILCGANRTHDAVPVLLEAECHARHLPFGTLHLGIVSRFTRVWAKCGQHDRMQSTGRRMFEEAMQFLHNEPEPRGLSTFLSDLDQMQDLLVTILFKNGDCECAAQVATTVLTGMPAAHMSEKQLIMVPVCIAHASSKQADDVAAQLVRLRQAPDLGSLRGRAARAAVREQFDSWASFVGQVAMSRDFVRRAFPAGQRHATGAVTGTDPLARVSRDLVKNLASWRQCDGCGTRSQQLRRCVACKSAWYCSAACQRSEWPNHRAMCRSKSSKGNGETIPIDSSGCHGAEETGSAAVGTCD